MYLGSFALLEIAVDGGWSSLDRPGPSVLDPFSHSFAPFGCYLLGPFWIGCTCTLSVGDGQEERKDVVFVLKNFLVPSRLFFLLLLY